MCIYIILVPTPTVSVTALNTQIVGQSLTLQCEVTTVRGITSRVDIVWSSGGTVLQRMNNVSSTMMSNSLVHTNYYNISLLSTTDNGRVIQCEVVINASPPLMGSGSIILDLTGKLLPTNIFEMSIFIYSARSYSHHITIWSHTRSYGG